jgi:hypothetical protein
MINIAIEFVTFFNLDESFAVLVDGDSNWPFTQAKFRCQWLANGWPMVGQWLANG